MPEWGMLVNIVGKLSADKIDTGILSFLITLILFKGFIWNGFIIPAITR